MDHGPLTLDTNAMTSPLEPFGQVAVRKGYVTGQQVETALAHQRGLRERGAPHKLIGMILLEEGFLSNAQLIDVLKTMELARSIGGGP